MRVAQFSGGLDSLAAVLACSAELDAIVTVITDGGSHEAYAEQVAAYVGLPLIKVKTDREINKYGHPVDVVPLRFTALGALTTGSPFRYQDKFSCCNRAIWQPLHAATLEQGATVIYRGQRNEDEWKAPLVDGQVVDGIEYRFPIADWTREKVIGFIEAVAPDLMPEYHARGEKTSRDCWDCTAYLKDNQQRIENLPDDQYDHVCGVIDQWRKDVAEEMGNA